MSSAGRCRLTLNRSIRRETWVKSYTLPPLPEVHFSRSWHEYLQDYLKTPAYFFGEIGLSKGRSHAGLEETGATDQLDARKRLGPHQGRGCPHRHLLVHPLPCDASLGAEPPIFRGTARGPGPDSSLAFNLAGLITFRLVADWPVLVNCPACGRKRLVNEPTCRALRSGLAITAAGRNGNHRREAETSLRLKSEFLTGLTGLTGLGTDFRQEEHEGHEEEVCCSFRFLPHALHVPPVALSEFIPYLPQSC